MPLLASQIYRLDHVVLFRVMWYVQWQRQNGADCEHEKQVAEHGQVAQPMLDATRNTLLYMRIAVTRARHIYSLSDSATSLRRSLVVRGHEAQ